MTKQDHTLRVQNIVDEMQAFADGMVYICPECGEYGEADYDDSHGYWTLECGCTADNEPEQATLYDYFSDPLDINYIIGADKRLKAVKILVTFGGPNIWIDTDDCKVKLYWWSDYAEAHIPPPLADQIDDIFADYYNF